MHAYLCVCGLNVCVCACMHACVYACVYCACIISCMFCAETHFYHLYFEFPVCFVQNLVLCVKLHVCFCAETQSDVVNFLCVFVQKPSSMCWISYMFLCRNPVLCVEFPTCFCAETQSYVVNFLCFLLLQKPSPICWISCVFLCRNPVLCVEFPWPSHAGISEEFPDCARQWRWVRN